MTDAIEFDSEELHGSDKGMEVKAVNHVLTVVVSTLLSMVITGLVSWFAFGPDAYMSKFKDSFMNREGTVKLIKEESPWVVEKPYIYDALREIQTAIKELKASAINTVRLEVKIDSIDTNIKGLNESFKRIDDRLSKVENHPK